MPQVLRNEVPYLEDYRGGEADIRETFALFADVMRQSIIPELPIPELARMRALFDGDPAAFLDTVERALFTSKDRTQVRATKETLSALRDAISALARERGITLASESEGGFAEAKKANLHCDPLECKMMNVLYVCVEKLAALLTHKLVNMALVQN